MKSLWSLYSAGGDKIKHRDILCLIALVLERSLQCDRSGTDVRAILIKSHERPFWADPGMET
jgi:hypothetical protein